MQAGGSREVSTSDADTGSDAESDGYGPEGLSWEAILHSMQVAEPGGGAEAEAIAKCAAEGLERADHGARKKGPKKRRLPGS